MICNSQLAVTFGIICQPVTHCFYLYKTTSYYKPQLVCFCEEHSQKLLSYIEDGTFTVLVKEISLEKYLKYTGLQ